VTRGRLREALGNAISPAELERMLRRLSPGETARLLASIEPKERAEQPGSFTLTIAGLPPVCPRCGFKSEPVDSGAPVVKNEGGNGNGEGR
jgi:predicted Zn-ribbon and HTH transcriptional regulator